MAKQKSRKLTALETVLPGLRRLILATLDGQRPFTQAASFDWKALLGPPAQILTKIPELEFCSSFALSAGRSSM